jgi:hypothetical protein
MSSANQALSDAAAVGPKQPNEREFLIPVSKIEPPMVTLPPTNYTTSLEESHNKNDDDDLEGGPLWQAASEEAESYLREKERRRIGPKLPESIMARARSRAEVDSFDTMGIAESSSSGYQRES